MKRKLRPGDICWTQTTKRHYGIYVGRVKGQPSFVHNTAKNGVILSPRKGFAGRRPIYLERPVTPGREREVVERAASYLGQPYSLLKFNCEHMANAAATGVKKSAQLQTGVAIVGLVTTGLTGLFIASRFANTCDTRVDENGYKRDCKGRFAK